MVSGQAIYRHKPIQWRKHRKMLMQLLSVSIVFIVFNQPVNIYGLLMVLKVLPENVNPQIYAYFYLICYLPVLLMPVFVLFSMPKEYWWHKWKQLFFNQQYRRQTTVGTFPT